MRDAADGYSVPFSQRATTRDIFYCFRLLLGRHPHPEEWRGHAMRTGEDLRGLVSSFAGSLESARLGVSAFGQPADAGSGNVSLTEIEGFSLYSATEDAAVGAAVRAGAYEPEICLLFRNTLKPGMGVLDIGANIGFFAMLSAGLVGPGGHVVAVEPNPGNVRLLEASRRKNGFANVTVLQVAAGREHGLLVLNTSYSNGTTSALPDSAEGVLAAQTVASLRLDAVVGTDRRIDLIKIDVEGAEYPALLGCEKIIRAQRPAIISEFSPDLMPGIAGIDGPGYLNWLTSLDYGLSVINPDGSVLPKGADVSSVMAAYQARNADHIDIFAEPV